ncbi:MAG: sodium ion-translocating decarboxylase subunit beta [Chlorobium sp.]|uniref:sodium ion-translocating decarboxylase subunit beta n=1 Tax=Chlorobium sp. TaxID=1095 RepID=UPI0025C4943F|nr:sodium ion-translocating decarboxylase subunit beta [Chlorobium sp.]MCF8216537.1 sodium ion-translocating decarboxylase subunit beta [Chlorobium sp.]MCF8271442.1 sodium ion-translocating decarboxylase subunit beta [Chlorobium sp.]MCF8287814.1 sodium ion-translocating decarboxylase subunit beta [Chlorobium sp.]MCF8291353.1 sodium ion-translocating decarboxylase subunit beta [Chlorobium sp.]MCF8385448.1 sodium ion-translocating decarboxylase subunit beta [Chlorobium sp.]
MRKILFLMLSLLCFTTAGYAQQFFQTEDGTVIMLVPEDLELLKVPVRESRTMKVGDDVRQGDFLGLFTDKHHNKITVTSGVSGHVTYINESLYGKYTKVPAGAVLLKIEKQELLTSVQGSSGGSERLSLKTVFGNLAESTGIYALIVDSRLTWTEGFGRVLMMSVGALLIYLAIAKGFEPLLLIPIGMGAVLSNIPLAFINDEGGILYYIFSVGIQTGVFPLLIFMGVGAMTDFGPMIANPKTSLLGGAAQFGIFGALIGALVLSQYVPGINFSMKDAASIGIIGGADGPTSIFVASRLSPALLGSIAVAAYSYMALVPIIQPPIMKLLTTEDERKIKMTQLRYVSKREKIIFPLVVIVLCALLLPSAAPLIGFLMFGNLMKECGVVERLSDTAQNALINIVTIFLGLGVGSKLSAEKFLNLETLGIIVLGLVAFALGTTAGVLMAKFMNLFLKQKINPLIGSAGVSAVPMAARVSNKVGLEADPHNFLLMHAMGPNVSGVIGSAVAAGVLLAVFM